MRIVERAAALVTVLAMPVLAWTLAQKAEQMWNAFEATPGADAGFALEDGIALGAATFGAAIASYLALTGYAMLLGALVRGGRAVPRALSALAPAGWTKVTATALGLSLSAGLAGPAFAAESAPVPHLGVGWVDAPAAVMASPEAVPQVAEAEQSSVAEGPAATDSAPETSALAVGWAPGDATPTSASATLVEPEATEAPSAARATDTPVGSVEPAAPAAPAAPGAHATPGTTGPSGDAHPTADYVVQAGDSLWRITESLLSAGATAADVAQEWPELYEANHAAIGDDPGLIQPGLRLTIPAGLAS